LHYACNYAFEHSIEETSVVKYLVCDLELEVDHCDEEGITPFHLASDSANVDVLKILYNRKPEVAMAKDKVDLFSISVSGHLYCLCLD
jgi:ankyrin repeat protein